MIELRFFRAGEHETDAAAIEEDQAARLEQQRQTENIPVKCCGTVEIMHVDRDLADS